MDISKLDTVKAANEGVELQLHNPGDMVDLGIFVKVLGRDSTEYRKLASEHNRKRVSKSVKGGNFRLGAISPEELESDALELLVSCTKAWRDEGEKLLDEIKVGGEQLKCTPENVRKVYSAYPWIKEQVDAAVNDRQLFLKR